MTMKNPVTPFLWFDDNLAAALDFYATVFADMRVHSRKEMTGPDGQSKLFSAQFEINGQRFMAMNGGPQYQFTPAVSFFIGCETQDEIDHHWDKLLEGGEAMRCGWVRDRFGLSWQVVPNALPDLIGGPDRAGAGRAMQAMLQMDKLDIAILRSAYEQQ